MAATVCSKHSAAFLDAMIRALAVQPDPAFRIPEEIVALGSARYAIASLGDRVVLFACAGGRLIRGPIGDAEAEVLRCRGAGDRDPSPLTSIEWHAAKATLAALGLVLDP